MTNTETSQHRTQAELNPAVVLRRRSSPEVEWVEIDGEIVAWSEENESLHLLDPIASLVFQLMDGSSSLMVTIGDLAEAFGRPMEQITTDVLTCVASLEEMGMLERVA